MAEITAAMVMKLRDETRLADDGLQEGAAGSRRRRRAGACSRLREIGQEDHGDAAGPQHRGRPDRRLREPQAGRRRDDRAAGRVGAGGEATKKFVQLANDLAKQLATGPGAKTPDELWKQPAPSRKGVTLRQWKDELESKMREVFRLARIHARRRPGGRLRAPRRQERRAAGSRGRQRRAGQGASPCTSPP